MNWHNECLKVHNEGLEALRRDGRLPFLLRPYDELGNRALRAMVLPDGIDDRARYLLRTKVVQLFRDYQIPAALMQSDTMQVNGPEFAEHFGLPQTLSPEKYQEEYLRILEEKFDGSVANLPRHLWQDAIATAIKGPKIPLIFMRTIYHKNSGGEIVTEETNKYALGFMNIIPDWWEPIKN